MAGRRIKPCDFCSGDYEMDYITDRNGYCLWLDINSLDNVMTVSAQANTEDGFMMEHSLDIQMNYCPVCGRKMND